MKFTQQRPEGINLISRYGVDFIALGANEIRESCIVTASAFSSWAPRSVDELTVDHSQALFAYRPDAVVLSTGSRQVFPRAALRAEFATREIGLTVARCQALFACRADGVLLSTGSRQVFPRAALRAQFATRTVGLEVMESGAACRTFNVLVGEERKVLAAILLPGPSNGPE